MPKFSFDLSTSGTHDVDSYILPAYDVPVVYNRTQVCATYIPENGRVECEIGDDIYVKLNNGKAMVRPFVEPDTNAASSRYLRIVEITIFDLD